MMTTTTDTTTTETATPRPRRVPLLTGSVTPLGASLLPLVPDAVSATSQAFGESTGRHQAAIEELRQAEAALKGAQAEDRRAAQAAELDGSPLPKAKAPAAQGALNASQRQVEAAEGAARQRQSDYLQALASAHAEVVARAKSELEKIASATASHLDAIEEALVLGVECAPPPGRVGRRRPRPHREVCRIQSFEDRQAGRARSAEGSDSRAAGRPARCGRRGGARVMSTRALLALQAGLGGGGNPLSAQRQRPENPASRPPSNAQTFNFRAGDSA